MRRKDEVENLEFKWGIKRGRGGAKKDVQFYESFTYDGEEYFLYDSVYLFQDNVPDPHIGKLIKIWEHQNLKKVKVLWYFRPSEISKYLGNLKVLENELFLATSDGNRNGDGSTNLNPLEAIAGKCNVVCISKDERNRQASLEELNMADFIFYRTFNVDRLTISAKLGEKIALVDVKCLLNKNDSQKSSLPRTEPSSEGNKEDFVASAEIGLLSQNEDTCKTLEPGVALGSCTGKSPVVDTRKNSSVSNTNGADTHVSQVTLKSSSGGGGLAQRVVGSTHAERSELQGMKHSATNIRKSQCGEYPALELDDGSKNFRGETRSVLNEPVSGSPVNGVKHSSPLSTEEDRMKKIEFSNNPRRPCEGAGEAKYSGDIKPSEGQASKKLKSTDHSSGNTMKLPAGGTNSKLKESLTPAALSNDKIKHECGKDPSKRILSPVKSADDSGALADRPSKKLKSDKHVSSSMQNVHSDSSGGKFKAPLSAAAAAAGGSGGSKLKPVVTYGSNTCLSKKLSDGGMLKKLPDDKFPKVPSKQISKEDAKVYGRVVEVTRRPDADNSIWFTSMPWEEKMKAAQVDGTLVMLQNLEPACTSSEVEDIVWHGFHESCTARMLQRTAMSSPHYGQALVIFKTEQAAKRVVRELEQGCLMLPNGRPLLAHVERQQARGKPSLFPGHLAIDRRKFQLQKEKREAVSTSHSSQHNTLEYDMAMEWCLLQGRINFVCKDLFKQQLEELSKLRRNLIWKSRPSAAEQRM